MNEHVLSTISPETSLWLHISPRSVVVVGDQVEIQLQVKAGQTALWAIGPNGVVRNIDVTPGELQTVVIPRTHLVLADERRFVLRLGYAAGGLIDVPVLFEEAVEAPPPAEVVWLSAGSIVSDWVAGGSMAITPPAALAEIVEHRHEHTDNDGATVADGGLVFDAGVSTLTTVPAQTNRRLRLWSRARNDAGDAWVEWRSDWYPAIQPAVVDLDELTVEQIILTAEWRPAAAAGSFSPVIDIPSLDPALHDLEGRASPLAWEGLDTPFSIEPHPALPGKWHVPEQWSDPSLGAQWRLDLFVADARRLGRFRVRWRPKGGSEWSSSRPVRTSLSRSPRSSPHSKTSGPRSGPGRPSTCRRASRPASPPTPWPAGLRDRPSRPRGR